MRRTLPAPALYRRLTIRDRGAWRRHFHRLGEAEREQRFRSKRDTPPAFTGPDGAQVVIGYFVGGTLRAVGELYDLGDRKGEIAMSVEKRFQSRGIGSALMFRLILAARNRLMREAVLYCASANARIRRIVMRAGGSIDVSPPDAEGTVHLLPPTAVTLFCEQWDEGSALLATEWRELWQRAA